MTADDLAQIYEANSKPGPRSVPAKLLPIPKDVDPEMALTIAAPYADFNALADLDDDGWRSVAKEFSENWLPLVLQAGEALGVSLEPTTVGGVKAFIVTPKEIAEHHRNQLVIHFHGGGHVFGASERRHAPCRLWRL